MAGSKDASGLETAGGDQSLARLESSPAPAEERGSTSGEHAVQGEVIELAAQRAYELVIASFSGPVPPPALLREYEEIVPGCANRMVEMAEREQAHRHSAEDRAIDKGGTVATRGQVFAFAIAMFGLAVALILGLANQGGAAAVIGAVDLAFLVGLFLRSDRPALPTRKPKDRAPRTPDTPAAGELAAGTDAPSVE